MKTYLIASLAIGISFALAIQTSANEVKADTSNYQKQAKAKIKLFASSLKSTLQKAIKEGGFENGVKACSETAPAISQQLSNDGWTLARVSLKERNPANIPDAWEKQVLIDFQEQKDQGVKIKKLTQELVEESESGMTYRFMKAIPTGGLCLSCHGSSIDPELRKVIELHYPEDKATGFELGDIRGAFTLSKKISP